MQKYEIKCTKCENNLDVKKGFNFAKTLCHECMNKPILKPQKEFPLLAKYLTVFKGITNRTIFAYDGVIYTNAVSLPHHLIVHEETHHRQQEKYGLDNWVDKYLSDTQFRLDMEIEAYRNQLQAMNRKERRELLKICAGDLSSNLYGNIISFNEAVELLKG